MTSMAQLPALSTSRRVVAVATCRGCGGQDFVELPAEDDGHGSAFELACVRTDCLRVLGRVA